MCGKWHISQCVKVLSSLLLSSLIFSLAALPAQAQGQHPSLPDPAKFVNKFEIVWNVVRAIYADLGYAIELEDKKGGRVVSRPYEFIAGALTASELEKIAVKKDSITGNLIRARYSVETFLEIISPTSTMVTVRTKMETLNREIDGSETWIPVESLGSVERKVLGKISMKLLGNEADLNAKKGFWDKSPQPADTRKRRPI